jgi:hypothetical protein
MLDFMLEQSNRIEGSHDRLLRRSSLHVGYTRTDIRCASFPNCSAELIAAVGAAVSSGWRATRRHMRHKSRRR